MASNSVIPPILTPSSLKFRSKKEKIELLERIQNYLTSKFAVSCGKDTNEEEYDSLVEFWESRGLLCDNKENNNDDVSNDEKDGNDEDDNNNDSSWYKQSHDYWQNQMNAPPTVDGMLGGFAILSDRDLIASRKFLDIVLQTHCPDIIQTNVNDTASNENVDVGGVDRKEDSTSSNNTSATGATITRSCECGAGIGRITKGLLLPIGISSCDLVETSSRLLQYAPDYIGSREDVEKCNFICKGLQDFYPPTVQTSNEGNDSYYYDIIWIQWVIGYLTDWDLVSFLSRMGKSLKPGGIIVIKDNCCNDMAFLADCNDSDITRSFHYLIAIVKESGLKIAADSNGNKLIEWQEDFPDDIWPVPMIVLKRA